jgi:hypothetical protein
MGKKAIDKMLDRIIGNSNLYQVVRCFRKVESISFVVEEIPQVFLDHWERRVRNLALF